MVKTWEQELKLILSWEDFPGLFFEFLQQNPQSENLFIIPEKDNNNLNIKLLKAIAESGMKLKYEEQSVCLWKKNTIPTDFMNAQNNTNIFIFGSFLFPNIQKFITFNGKNILVLHSLSLMNKDVRFKKATWNLLKKYYLK